MIDTARVVLWGKDIGAVTWLADRGIGVFQYTADFTRSGIEVAPVMMPLREAPYEFPTLSTDTFKGLPGLLADSLPDRFGNALIDAWLARQGRESFTPLERLCYTGTRGMGALEFEPMLGEVVDRQIDVDLMVGLANRVLDERISLEGKFTGEDDEEVIRDILHIGTSAGGARAKAVLAWNPDTGEFRSGQAPAAKGFSHWLMKFDGVDGNRDKETVDPMGFGQIEYAYYLMATAAGIDMQECRLHEEGGRAHFMTQRFDRPVSGGKLHMQSLGAMMHYDFNMAGAYAYEQSIILMRRLRMPMSDIEQQVRRTFFNVLARNQDDHVKNIAFLMNREGQWRLSPAFDVAYSYNPKGDWTHQHQMSVNGKRRHFEVDDLIQFSITSGVKATKAKKILREVSASVESWQTFADKANIQSDLSVSHRHNLFI